MPPPDPSTSFTALAALVLLLGMKHGFDADHLAAIDGLTRFNARDRPRLARRVGALFSAGHGAVVFAVALGVSALAGSARVPGWFDAVGAWVSITVLTALAVVNIRAAFVAPRHAASHAVGWRTGLFARLLSVSSAWRVMGVGGLFALSFDTLSQATLFAAASTRLGGWEAAVLLAGLFVFGMLVTDGLNGLWIARLIRRSDHTAVLASRITTLGVGGVSLLTAAIGVAAQTSGAAEAWALGKEMWLGAAVVAIVLASFVIGMWLARPAASAAAAGRDIQRTAARGQLT
ncbi:hypothetical protein BH11PSE8_BH11PSE8_17380 [soil metagenome]